MGKNQDPVSGINIPDPQPCGFGSGIRITGDGNEKPDIVTGTACRPHGGGDSRVLSARQHGSRARASGSGAPTIVPHHTSPPYLFKEFQFVGNEY